MESINSSVVSNHNQKVIKPPSFNRRVIQEYLRTRFSSLFVPREELQKYSYQQIFNPFKPLMTLNRRQWAFFMVGFWGWTWDAFDFFAVSLNVTNLAQTFSENSTHEITVKQVSWGITLVLMLRTVGAIIFGILADRIGRKWPYIINLVLLIILQIGCSFVQTYKQFLGVRALFGIAMGGVFGLGAATAMEDVNDEARGVISGIFQQGYAFGYLLVVVFQRAIVDNSSHGWRALFWFSAGPPVLMIIGRLLLPETDAFILQTQKLARERALNEKRDPNSKLTGMAKVKKSLLFSESTKRAIKTYWFMFVYLVLLMSGFNFMSHGSQDLYPTLLTVQYGYGSDRSTVTNSVANLGAMFGGFLFGHFSTFIGRRLAIIIACVIGGAFIYPWAFLTNSGINAGAFFLQLGVQGAWGVIPIHLSELAPPQYRALISGVAYQMGNLCSSASSTIEATIGERFPLEGKPPGVYNYAKVMSIFMGCVFTYVIFMTFMGPENRNADFDVERDLVLDLPHKEDFSDDNEPYPTEKANWNHGEDV